MSTPDYLSTATRLRRSKKGDTVHRAACARARNALPWIWAENFTDAQILANTSVQSWIKPCRICNPFTPERSR